jgi:hypothetical protein
MRLPLSRLRRLALALPLALGACVTWAQRPTTSPRGEQFFAGPVRVTRGDGTPILLDSVTVRADSVVGREQAPPHARVAIPAGEVRAVEARRTDPIGTMMVVFVPMLAAVALWASYKLGRAGFND